MFNTPGIAIVFLGHTRGICAVAAGVGVLVGNSGEIGHPGKVTSTASGSSMWTVCWPILTLPSLGGSSSSWSGRSRYNRYEIMQSRLNVVEMKKTKMKRVLIKLQS